MSDASKILGYKDITVGAMKETLGAATGNQKLELTGKAQKVHGKHEVDYAQAYRAGKDEPDQFANAYHSGVNEQEESKAEEPSKLSGRTDQFVGGIKETIGSATGNQNMELIGKAQSVHGRNEVKYSEAQKEGLAEPENFVQAPEHATGSVEGDQASSLSAMKDRAIGGIKQTIGSATGNPQMELVGKAQSVHGRNESEFAKAQRQGLDEPEHFAQGTKSVDHAEGSVEGTSASTLGAAKDRIVGGIKEAVGSMTGNQKTELLGKAQSVHGRNEAEFAKAERLGLNEPEHFGEGTKATEHAEGSIETGSGSSLSAMKDRVVGGLKEAAGSMTGNQKTELLGKAQKVHGRNEAEFLKAEREGLHEPEHFAQGTKVTDHAQGSVQGDSTSSLSALSDRVIGSVKETVGSATGNQKMELLGKAQSVHGRNEAEFVKAQRQGLDEPEHYAVGTKTTQHAQGTVEGDQASSLSAAKDRMVGGLKEVAGSVTGNQKTELLGKAQSVHGRNEAEFAKAERLGLNEPEHFGEGTKATQHAEGSVVGENPSALSALKDRLVGGAREAVGSMTGDQKTELIGKAQKVHGRNESEFAKAAKEGLSEPAHFGEVEPAQGSVEGDRVSSVGAMKDRAIGSIKETIGSATGNQEMELLGKAQAVHGRNEAEFARAETKNA